MELKMSLSVVYFYVHLLCLVFIARSWHFVARLQLRIVNEDGETVDIGEYGEIEVKNPGAASGYLHNKEASQQLFTSDGFLRTG